MPEKKYEGITDGTINGSPYESITRMRMLDSGELIGDIIITKLPEGFHPAYLSLSNSSQKVAILTKPDGTPSIYDFLQEQGSVISSRIYTYPDFPTASFSQIGKADLTHEGISYKNTLNGFSGNLPTDILKIKDYNQIITKREKGGLFLKASTIIVSESIGEIRTEILGTYTFEGDKEFEYEYNLKHSPSFEVLGENSFKSKGFDNGRLVIKMSQFVVAMKQIH
ncbi:hypothetical protein [Pinibacter soli]|uniref:Uncharacterized protein n=1 Tax=Pinibacter soli TaxID=3044211 RepID=A0ABT6RHF0_9BACT|nr:hypothetical protein [Pinibacter soli]MDI3321999.1 hypothetical protein [Pinibacter soli]